MAKTAIFARGIFTEHGIVRDKYLLIDGNKFAGFAPLGELPSDISIRKYPHSYILPGLIDTHIHGAVGCDTMDASSDSLQKIGDYLLSQGTTAFMPTTVTAPLGDIYRAITSVSQAQNRLHTARILGMFIEGPYITSEHKGAHPENCIRPLNRDEILKMNRFGIVKSIIIAPEKENAADYTDWLTQKLGIRVSLGHSSADYDDACRCFDAGADASVHTYCGMNSLHHRSPNLLGAALTRDDVYAELIADGIHVSIPAIKILMRCKPADKVILISDAIRAAGLADGRYMLGILPFNVKNGIARIDSGNIAGSTSTLLKEVKLLIEQADIEPSAAVNMASINPARRFRMDDKLGSIKIGKYADFLVVSPKYEVEETWLGGQLAFHKNQ